METGDGLLVRVRATAGRLTASQAYAVAQTSNETGNGLLDLSTRANLQIRGVTTSSLPTLTSALQQAGLVPDEPDMEHVRNVLADPLCDNAPELAARIENALVRTPALQDLPAKFGCLIDRGGPLSLDGLHTDIGFQSINADRFSVRIGGDALTGQTLGTCESTAVPDVARDIALRFLEVRSRVKSQARRLRDLLSNSSITQDEFRDIPHIRTTNVDPAPTERSPAAHTVGPAADRAPWVGFGLPFGRSTADGLRALAALCSAVGDGSLRLTPWHAILVRVDPVRRDRANRKAARLAEQHGLIFDPISPLRRVAACPGRNGCSHGHVDTQSIARELAGRMDLSDPGATIAVHVSGCAKGCAHPARAPITLVGCPDGLAVVLDGDSGAAPVAMGLAVRQALDILESDFEQEYPGPQGPAT